MGKTLILIDGHALAFRQYYALERTQMSTTDGTPTWAVYGFFKSVFDLLKNTDLKADAIAVAFDVSHVTFRTEKYEQYKSNRSAMPDNMQVQMNLIYDGLKAFNIPIYTKQGYEADDVIGTISKRACELGHKVLILTGDQDAFQLVDKDGCIKVMLPSKGELIEYNWDKIYEKLGVYPNQVIDYKGLRGDTSDCIPGIKGIGEKTAQKLLAQFGTLDNILDNADEIKEKSVKEKIKSGKDIAKLSQELATIVRNLDVDFDFDSTKVELPNIEKVTEFLKNMQFHTFIKNINSILSTFNKSKEVMQISNSSENDVTQLGLFTQTVTQEINKSSDYKYDKKLITDSQDLEELSKELNEKSVFAFKVYADYRNAIHTQTLGISLSFVDNLSYKNGNLIFSDNSATVKTFYIPVIHSNINTLPQKDIINLLKPVFENDGIKKITYNCKEQINILRNDGIKLTGIVFDNILASYVKDSSRNHDIDVQAFEHLNHVIVPYTESKGKSAQKMSDVDIIQVLDNVSGEAAMLIALTQYWLNNLNEKELKLVQDIEIPLSVVLADMEHTGVAINQSYLESLTTEILGKLSKIEKSIYNLAGCGFNINSPKQVGEILFDKLGLKTQKKNTKHSTSSDILEELAQNYKIAQDIIDYRKYTKLKTTYTEALPMLADKKDNRVHTTYNQTTAATGRLSSSNPNLQNIPARTEEGNKIRSAFVPENKEEYLILSADYSQIELRLLAHISQDENLIAAFNSGVDVHTLTASKVFSVSPDEVTKEMRSKAKAVNFGIVYGQTKYGLAKALSISNQEAEEFIDKYFTTYPRVKEYMDNISAKVMHDGYVETIFGRKRYFETELRSSNRMIQEFAKRAAINHPIQGTAADLMKIAMIECYKNLKTNSLKSKMIMQVHDEIVVEAKKLEIDTVQAVVRKSMELEQPLSVPLIVDMNIGETWKEQ